MLNYTWEKGEDFYTNHWGLICTSYWGPVYAELMTVAELTCILLRMLGLRSAVLVVLAFPSGTLHLLVEAVVLCAAAVQWLLVWHGSLLLLTALHYCRMTSVLLVVWHTDIVSGILVVHVSPLCASLGGAGGGGAGTGCSAGGAATFFGGGGLIFFFLPLPFSHSFYSVFCSPHNSAPASRGISFPSCFCSVFYIISSCTQLISRSYLYIHSMWKASPLVCPCLLIYPFFPLVWLLVYLSILIFLSFWFHLYFYDHPFVLIFTYIFIPSGVSIPLVNLSYLDNKYRHRDKVVEREIRGAGGGGGSGSGGNGYQGIVLVLPSNITNIACIIPPSQEPSYLPTSEPTFGIWRGKKKKEK